MPVDCTSVSSSEETTTDVAATTTTYAGDDVEMQQLDNSLLQSDAGDEGRLEIVVEDPMTDDDLRDDRHDAGQCAPPGELADHHADVATADCPSTSANELAAVPADTPPAIIIQPCPMVLPTNSAADTAGSTIAETLHGLISPGSTVYAGGTAVASSTSMMESDGTSDCGHVVQMTVSATSPLSIPPPIAILAPVDQRSAAQQGAVGGGTPQGEMDGSASTKVVAAVSSRQQHSVCQLVEPSPQGLVAGQETAVMTPAGAAVYGTGAPIITTETAALQSQIDVAMACQQQYLGSATIQTGQSFQTPVMALPQTLQVIQAAPQHQFVQQQCLQQQYMFQTNPVQIPGGVGVAPQRPVSKSPTILPIAPQTSLSNRLSMASVVSSKGTAAVAPQPICASKPQQQPQQQQLAQNSTSVLSQLGGMIQNTGVAQQMILPQQQQPRAISLCQVNQPINLGQVGSPLQFGQPVNLGPVNQTLNFGQAGQPLALGQVNQTLNLSQVNQVIGNPGQIRFTAMPNFGFNAAGQLVGGTQTLLNFQNVPLMQQPLLSSQPTTILGSQPLYIRTAEPFVQQQTPSFAVANVQAVTPIRNMMIPQSTPSTTSSRRLQVQPNNAIAPSATSTSKPPSITTASSVTKGTVKTTKPLVPATSTSTLPKTVASATVAQPRPVKPMMTVAVTPKTPLPPQQSSAASLTAVVSASAKTTASSVAASVPSTSAASVPVIVTADITVVPTATTAMDTSSTTITTTTHQDHVKISPIAAKPSEEKSKPVNVITDKTKNSVVVMSQEKKCEEKPPMSTKSSVKSKKPKILTHVIEGFIIQEASEPFPVQGSSLISQIWSPKIPPTTDDGYSSPKSEKETDDDDHDDHSLKTNEHHHSDVKKPRLDSELSVFTKSEEPLVFPPSTALPPASPPEGEARLTCEFCGKRDFIHKFARSRRFCSVTCSKRFSAYSMRKAPDGSVTGRPTSTKNSRPRGSSAQSRTVVTSSATATVDSKPSSQRLPDPRVTAIKTAATVCSSESEDTDLSNGAGSSSHAGDSSPGSQSPPALERVERLADKDLSEDGVLIPPRPLAQWGVQDVYDFIRTLPGCSMYADEFRQQEIDGSALMLLKEDHLMMTMNVKLGPALKICSRVSSLKE